MAILNPKASHYRIQQQQGSVFFRYCAEASPPLTLSHDRMNELLQNKELLEQIVAGTASAILVTLLAYLLRKFYFNKVRIRRVRSRTNRFAEQTLDLYARIFPNTDGTDYTREDMYDIMDENFGANKHVHAENIILVAEYNDTVIGFIFAHYYKSHKKCIISYYATTPDNTYSAAKAATPVMLLKKLRRILLSRRCTHLFFDLQGNHTFTDEWSRKHRGRAKAFSQRAKQLGLRSLMCQFDYISPKLSLDPDYKESRCTLHFIPMKHGALKHVPKVEMIRHLEFVYQCCYGDIYDMDHPHFRPYQAHLASLVNRYRKLLPDPVPVSEP